MIKKIKLSVGFCYFIFAYFLFSCHTNKQKKLIRVACIGASITYNDKISDRENRNYTKWLAYMLGENYQVKNFGIDNSSAINKINQKWNQNSYEKVLEFEPNIIICQFGIDDNIANDITKLISKLKTQVNNPSVYICNPFIKPTEEFENPTNKEFNNKMLSKIIHIAKETNSSIIDLSLKEQMEEWLVNGVYTNSLVAYDIAKKVAKTIFSTKGNPFTLSNIPIPSAEYRWQSADWEKKTWIEVHEHIKKISASYPKSQLIFIGNSITQNLTGTKNRIAQYGADRIFDKYFAKYQAINMGIAGDRTENILYRIKHGGFDNINPNVIVLTIGINNIIAGNNSSDEVFSGTKEIIKQLHKKEPQSKIIVLGCLPADNPNSIIRKKINNLHKKLKSMTKKDYVKYVNINHIFLDNNENLNPKYVRNDKTHLRPEGSKIWLTAIKDLIDDLMN